ncbi:Aminotran-5 domain-containing protein [Mycena venus]|uniref:alanine--glyoxylate transaminase n=1 Tax=Mycena venus TaxID=2733690 RepID=A0A8H6YEJ2_9AGAR|nr:Aminotran-5 domain-containing protein [Mycena venus]
MTTVTDFKQAPHKLNRLHLHICTESNVVPVFLVPSKSPMRFSTPMPILPCRTYPPDFIPVLGDCIRMTREVVLSTEGQPFLISGSGTLGWDQARHVAANLIQPGENALVLHSGYFGDSFTECLETYGAKVDQLKAEIGAAVSQDAIESALKSKKYRLLTFTHVDTSTAVLSDAKAISETVRRVSPDTLVILDGVCSVASEELRMDAWGIDVVLTASQKGLGVPPGLSILVASPRAIKVFESRTAPVGSYYASWKKWLPIMKAYEEGRAAYFATPPVNLIYAYHTALTQITKKAPSLEERFELHRAASKQIKDTATQLGLKQLALEPAFAAMGMTALYFPDGMSAADVIPKFGAKGIIVAGGLHAAIKDKYFRVGHMGITAVDGQRGDIQSITNALKEVFAAK